MKWTDFLPFLPSAVLLIYGVWILVHELRLRRRLKKWRRKMLQATDLCPHCLGTGRVPRPGYHYDADDHARFAQLAHEEQKERSVPGAFKDAFKEKN